MEPDLIEANSHALLYQLQLMKIMGIQENNDQGIKGKEIQWLWSLSFTIEKKHHGKNTIGIGRGREDMVATYRWMEQNRCRGDKAEKGGAGSRKDDDGREETGGDLEPAGKRRRKAQARARGLVRRRLARMRPRPWQQQRRRRQLPRASRCRG
jgi:hypothetical protein